MVDVYVVQDRTIPHVPQMWTLTMVDGELVRSPSILPPDPDPVIPDFDDEVTHWTLYVDDGDLGWEVTLDPLTNLTLTDTVTAQEWEIGIETMTISWRLSTEEPPFLEPAFEESVFDTGTGVSAVEAPPPGAICGMG